MENDEKQVFLILKSVESFCPNQMNEDDWHLCDIFKRCNKQDFLNRMDKYNYISYSDQLKRFFDFVDTYKTSEDDVNTQARETHERLRPEEFVNRVRERTINAHVAQSAEQSTFNA